MVNVNDYEKIRTAIEYIAEHKTAQPKLEAIAQALSLSPSHVQKLFLRWAGVSPKRFLQALTVEDAKRRLSEGASVLDASLAGGLSSASRLYDHFIELESVTPGEFKTQGMSLQFFWGHVETPFGMAFLVLSGRGIVQLTFIDDKSVFEAREEFVQRWPKAELIENQTAAHKLSRDIFAGFVSGSPNQPIKLCVSGTNFQVAVWRALLKVQPGTLTTYSAIAAAIDKPKAVRAVASAIAANPVACLIPCHRVIRQSGALGGYRWGLERKQALLVKELKHV